MMTKFLVLVVAILLAYWYNRKPASIDHLFDSDSFSETVKPHAGYKRIENPFDGVYAALYYALANVIVLNNHKNEWLIIDTTESCDKMSDIIDDMVDMIGTKPSKIIGIVYTHFHWDHVAGGGVVVEYAQKTLGQTEPVRLIAHESFMTEYSRQLKLAKSGYPRGMGQFGQLLDERLQINAGLGPRLFLNLDSGYCMKPPTEGVTDELTITHGQWTVDIFHAPGETDDHVSVFIREIDLLLPGDNVYPHFPNIYAIRGAPTRSASQWAHTVKRMSRMKPKMMIGSHGPVVKNEDEVSDILESYHDAIKYVHDQTVRSTELLLDLDDVVESAKLPKKLANHPWLSPTYGTVEWASRGVYDSYVGWFDGRAVNLRQLKVKDESKKLVDLAGGVTNVKAQIKRQIDEAAMCDKNIGTVVFDNFNLKQF